MCAPNNRVWRQKTEWTYFKNTKTSKQLEDLKAVIEVQSAQGARRARLLDNLTEPVRFETDCHDWGQLRKTYQGTLFIHKLIERI